MSVVKSVVYDGGMQRQVQPGDTFASAEIIATDSSAVGNVMGAAEILSGIYSRSGPGAAYTDTTDTAANIISAMLANQYAATGSTGISSGVGVQPGTTFRLRYINTVAFVMTLAAGTGVTLGANTAIAASSAKEYLFTVTNGTPQQVFAATVDGSTKVITGLTQFQTSQLSVGMTVTGTGIAASSTIQSIQPGVGVTLNNNTTVAGTLVALTFSPSITVNSLGQMLL